VATVPSGQRQHEGLAGERTRPLAWGGLAARLAIPALLVAAALVLPAFILSSDREIRGGGVGPTAWPRVMLLAITVLAVVWMVQEWLGWRRGLGAGISAVPEEGAYSMTKAAAGLVLVVLYGWLLPIVGFPVATTGFMAAWCYLGGIRNPVALLAVPLGGTAALLWMFMGVATMPLPRGTGAFDRASIALLQMLGIY
jgi:putative tricarboxylic transport membrane protein